MTKHRAKRTLTQRQDVLENSFHQAIAREEGAVLCGLAATLIVAGWAFGGVENWTRNLILAGSTVTFFLALVPLPDRRRPAWEEVSFANRLRSLLRFPPFWLGFLLFGYVVLQWTNPDFRYVSGEKEGNAIWWLTNEGLDPRAGWPTSIEAPISRGSPLSFLQRYGAAWLLVCAIWIGLRNRRSFVILLGIVGVHFAVYGLITFLQEIDGNNLVLWFRQWGGKDFSGAFFYRNHGGAYLYLGVAALLALHLGLLGRGSRGKTDDRVGLRFLVLSAAGLCGAAAILSESRAAWVGTLIVAFVYFLLFLWRFFVAWPPGRKRPLDWIMVLAVPAVAIGLVLFFGGSSAITDRLDQTRRSLNAGGPMLAYRGMGNELSRLMFETRPVFGYGADSYGHVVGLFQDELKRIMRFGVWPTVSGMKTIWVAAHNDFLQALVELGRVGATLFLLPLLFWFGLFVRYLRRFTAPMILLLAAAVCLLGHSYIDLIFQSGTLVVYFSAIIACLGRWTVIGGR